MKKLFEELELDVIRFGAADILTASAAEETPAEEPTEEPTEGDETPVEEQGEQQQQQIWNGTGNQQQEKQVQE